MESISSLPKVPWVGGAEARTEAWADAGVRILSHYM